MARFMIANLNHGAIDGKRFMSETASRQMLSTQFRNNPRVAGWAYGFYEWEQNDLHLFGHGGSMDDGYSASLTLVPEKNFGIFIACNTESGAEALGDTVKDEILKPLFPCSDKAGST
jgi:CubicO group peptidase (beta-lactamase class C family)